MPHIIMRDGKIRKKKEREKENDVHGACFTSLVPLSFESALYSLHKEWMKKTEQERDVYDEKTTMKKNQIL